MTPLKLTENVCKEAQDSDDCHNFRLLNHSALRISDFPSFAFTGMERRQPSTSHRDVAATVAEALLTPSR